MSEQCSRNCETCAKACADRKQPRFLEKPHELSRIKKVIGIVSGKGGVGKSLVTSLLAVSMKKKGYQTGILDADITGPSIPKVFGLREKAKGSELGLFPVETAAGIRVMSLNLLVENETDPVVWRGPVIAGMVKRFWKEVVWGDIDFLFIDMPPGTGDVPLTVFQSIPVDGIVIVTTPQELVSMIVTKAVNMAKRMNIPILGLVENMSYVKCPCCGEEIELFGESRLEEVARQTGIKTTARLPVNPDFAAAGDKGSIEAFEETGLGGFTDILEQMMETEVQP